MVASATRIQPRKCLNDVDFPASKQDLIDDETVRALRAIPPETYTNVGQIAVSVTIADDRGNDGAQKAATHSPIVEELGENRGS